MSIWPKGGRVCFDTEDGPRLKRRLLDESVASSVLNDSLASGDKQGGSSDPELLGVMWLDAVDAEEEVEEEAEIGTSASSFATTWEVSEARRLEAINSSTAFCRSAGRDS